MWFFLAAALTFPPYVPQQPVCGTVRLWGHGSTKVDFMRRLVTRWTTGFARYQPGIRFDYRMYGTASAIGALYRGEGDLALMGEEIFPFEESAYEGVMHHPPGSVEIATGSLDVRNFDFAQMFFVQRSNPLRSLTLRQLDAIWGTERRLGAPRAIRTWGDLGLGGSWAKRPIHLYGWSFDNDFWIYLGQAMLGGSHHLNPAVRGYAHILRPDGTIYDAGQQILEAVARDPDALGLSNLRYATAEVRAVSVAAGDGDEACAATKENLINRKYPLTRVIPAVFNQAPGQPMDPAVREFLRYILSEQGQRDIAEDGEYLPLSPQAAQAARARLDEIDERTIRVRASVGLGPQVQRWENAYRADHPDAGFENIFDGGSAAIAGLYTGTADIAFLARNITPVETMAFAWVYRYPPTGVKLGRGTKLSILVSQDNPIAGLTLAQLDAIFDWERKRGGPDLAAWGQLGLTGEWADRPIHGYIPEVDSAPAVFFRDQVLLGSRRWNWARITEAPRAGVAEGDSGAVVVTAGDEPVPGLKAVPVTEGELALPVMAYVNRRPGQPFDPKVAGLVQYLSGEPGASR